jgi:inner membrane protein
MERIIPSVNEVTRSTFTVCYITFLFAVAACSIWSNVVEPRENFLLISFISIVICAFISVPPFVLLLIIHLLLRRKSIDRANYYLLTLSLLNLYLSIFYMLIGAHSSGFAYVILAINIGFVFAQERAVQLGRHPLISHFSLKQYFNMEHPSSNPTERSESASTPAAHSNYLTKLIVLAAMALVLYLGTFLVGGLINERQGHQDKARQFFRESWGDQQTIAGPYISIPYRKQLKDGTQEIHYAYLMPRSLKLNNQLNTFQRKQGIYEVQVYRAEQQYAGDFKMDDLLTGGIPFQALMLDKAVLSFGLTDVSALERVDYLKLNGKEYEAEPLLPTQDITSEGISVSIDLSGLTELNFDAAMSLRGTERIAFLPTGKSTDITVTSAWPSPSFFGRFLPNERPDTNGKGFSGQWKLQHLNRGFPQAWVGSKYNLKGESFGVSLMEPVNNYTQSERIVKYALLVIGLVFTIFFFIELLQGKNIHPLQYLLVGFALCLFYSLMVAFSEHIAFIWAYWAAAFMTIMLISGYLKSVLKSNRPAIFSLLSMTAIYGFLYMLLLQEDYALLIGNIGLFVVLATVMYVSRKVQWTSI